MRRFSALILAGSLVASASAYAGDTALQPGKPAGVHQAQIDGGVPTIVFLGVMAAIGITIAIASSNESTPAAAVVTTTATTTTTA